MPEEKDHQVIDPIFENSRMSLVNQYKIATYRDKTKTHVYDVLKKLDDGFVSKYGQRTDTFEPDTKKISEEKKADLITLTHYIDKVKTVDYAEKEMTLTGNRLSVYLEGMYLERACNRAFKKLTKEQHTVIDKIYGRIILLYGRTIVSFCYGDGCEDCVTVIDQEEIISDEDIELKSRTVVMGLIHLSNAIGGRLSVDNCPSPKEKHERFSYTNVNGVITLDGEDGVRA